MIKDDISREPNIVKFNGKEYDLQYDLYCVKEIAKRFKGGIDEAISNFDKLDVIFELLTVLLNNAIVCSNYENDENEKLLNADYVAAKLDSAELVNIIKAVAKALGLKEKEKDDELDSILDEKGIEEKN